MKDISGAFYPARNEKDPEYPREQTEQQQSKRLFILHIFIAASGIQYKHTEQKDSAACNRVDRNKAL